MLALIIMCLVAVSMAVPVQDNEIPTILKYENTNDGLGSYKFEYETSDGTSRTEEGFLSDPNDPDSFIVVGSYEYLGPDGVLYSVTYTADANGFHPQGAHIPSIGAEYSPTSGNRIPGIDDGSKPNSPGSIKNRKHSSNGLLVESLIMGRYPPGRITRSNVNPNTENKR